LIIDDNLHALMENNKKKKDDNPLKNVKIDLENVFKAVAILKDEDQLRNLSIL
jgi:hypothetical protein